MNRRLVAQQLADARSPRRQSLDRLQLGDQRLERRQGLQIRKRQLSRAAAHEHGSRCCRRSIRCNGSHENRALIVTVPMAGYVSGDEAGPVQLADFAPLGAVQASGREESRRSIAAPHRPLSRSRPTRPTTTSSRTSSSIGSSTPRAAEPTGVLRSGQRARPVGRVAAGRIGRRPTIWNQPTATHGRTHPRSPSVRADLRRAEAKHDRLTPARSRM